jgi:murein DD-endopeptidase MepM/ murein hydrolase activator NlpD
MGITTLFSIIISVLYFLFLGSPIDRALEQKVNDIKNDFLAINIQLDSLQDQLHSKHFIDDKFYRELLELDSLPHPIRLAGTGGSEEDINLKNYPYHELIAETNLRLKTIKNQIKIQDESYTKITKKAISLNSKLRMIPAIQPLKPASNIWISSRYGYRTDPFTRIKKRHKGIDFSGPKNTKIYATADGIITNTKDSRRGYGKEIIISHKFGYSTRYAHLNEILVKKGQKIQRGELIGLMGNTGRSTGTHLHYEVRLNKRQVDPIFYFANDLDAKEYNLITQLSLKDKN